MDHHNLDFHEKYADHQPTFPIPTSLAYVAAILYLGYQLLIYLGYPILSPQELFWNALVYILPARLLLDAAKRRELKQTNMLSQTHAAKSEALRISFAGAGQPALLQKLSAGTLSRQASGLTAQQPGSNRPPGLGNWDNSCYQNSVLQGLASLESLKPFLRKVVVGESANDSTGASLLETVNELNNVANNGKRLWTPAKLKSMSSWQQQDAQEYFSKVMDELDKEAGKTWAQLNARPGLESIVEETDALTGEGKEGQEAQNELLRLHNPLEGYLAQRVACTNCGYFEGLSMIPFNCLTVPLGPLPTYLIDNCLDEYTKLEEISEVECAKCTLLKWETTLQKMLRTAPTESNNEPQVDDPVMSLPPDLRAQTLLRLTAIRNALDNDDFSDQALNIDCQILKKGRVSSTKTRQAVIGRAPQSLMIHVNRSIFDELTGAQKKNYAAVQYPWTLDLRPWMLAQTASEPCQEGGSGIGQAKKSMLSERPNLDDSCIYRLKAVVTHYGRHENGHYICYRSYPVSVDDAVRADDPDADEVDLERDMKPRWWCLSDDDVSPVMQEDVLAQGGVFMLFYEREREPSLSRYTQVNEQSSTIAALSRDAVTETVTPESQSGDVTTNSDVPSELEEQRVSPENLRPTEKPEITMGSSSETISEPQVEGKPEVKSSHSTGFSQPNLVQSTSTTPQHPVMRTAGARRTSRNSLKEKKNGFGAAKFRPMAAT